MTKPGIGDNKPYRPAEPAQGEVDRGSRRNPTGDFETRGDRVAADFSPDRNREVNDDTAFEVFRSLMTNSALPELPKLAGFHLFWATTTNPRDTVQMRMAMGYQLVKPEELPGWIGIHSEIAKSGEFAGCVMHNEMIAMKIPDALYHRFMKEAHHDAPQRDAAAIYQRVRDLADSAKGQGSRIDIGDGMETLKADNSLPTFTV